MNGLARLVSDLTHPLELSDRTLHLSKITVRDIAEREQYILKHRMQGIPVFDDESLSLVLKASSKEVRQAIIGAITDVVKARANRPTFATFEEASAFDASHESVIWSIMASCRRVESNLVRDMDDARVLYYALRSRDNNDYAKLINAIDSFSWDSIRGNS